MKSKTAELGLRTDLNLLAFLFLTAVTAVFMALTSDQVLLNTVYLGISIFLLLATYFWGLTAASIESTVHFCTGHMDGVYRPFSRTPSTASVDFLVDHAGFVQCLLLRSGSKNTDVATSESGVDQSGSAIRQF